jgi:hypothetical protein
MGNLVLNRVIRRYLSVVLNNTNLQVEHMGTGWQNIDKQTEHTNPISMIFL